MKAISDFVPNDELARLGELVARNATQVSKYGVEAYVKYGRGAVFIFEEAHLTFDYITETTPLRNTPIIGRIREQIKIYNPDKEVLVAVFSPIDSPDNFYTGVFYVKLRLREGDDHTWV